MNRALAFEGMRTGILGLVQSLPRGIIGKNRKHISLLTIFFRSEPHGYRRFERRADAWRVLPGARLVAGYAGQLSQAPPG